jgi:YfiR/HmsC-like
VGPPAIRAPRTFLFFRANRSGLATLAATILCCGRLAGAQGPGPTVGADVGSLEYGVKAAFLYNFVKFVEWPNSAFHATDSPVAICVLGADPFGRTLDDIVEGERVESRPLVVRRVDEAREAGACHLLFVSSSERTRFAPILAAVNTRRVLTVAESTEFLAAGGHIAFYLEANRVRFAINTGATAKSEFQVSSKLLRVARIYEARSGLRPAR